MKAEHMACMPRIRSIAFLTCMARMASETFMDDDDHNKNIMLHEIDAFSREIHGLVGEYFTQF